MFIFFFFLFQMHVAANHRENERAQAVKSSSQSSSLVKYLEQRELALLRSLQDERKTHGNGSTLSREGHFYPLFFSLF